MKKVFFTMLMAVAAMTSFAQNNPKIDKEVKATKDFQAGKALIESKLAELSDEEKAKAYNELYKLIQPAFEKSMTAAGEQKMAEVDNNVVVNALETAALCEKYGSKDAAKYVAEVTPIRPVLINAANSTDNTDEKLTYSMAYINTAKQGDNFLALANYFAGYAYYLKEDYTNAAKYAKGGIGDERVNGPAEQVYRVSMEKNCKTKADTLAYIDALKQLDSKKYFVQICTMLTDLGEKEQVNKLVEETIAKEPDNKFAWYIRGTTKNEDNKFDEAIEDFKKVIEIDPAFVYGYYNLALCYGNKADDINAKKADKNGRLYGDDLKVCSEAYNGAITNLEKVRELDPNHETIHNWPMQLRMYYNRVGNKAKADEISKMLGDA